MYVCICIYTESRKIKKTKRGHKHAHTQKCEEAVDLCDVSICLTFGAAQPVSGATRLLRGAAYVLSLAGLGACLFSLPPLFCSSSSSSSFCPFSLMEAVGVSFEGPPAGLFMPAAGFFIGPSSCAAPAVPFKTAAGFFIGPSWSSAAAGLLECTTYTVRPKPSALPFRWRFAAGASSGSFEVEVASLSHHRPALVLRLLTGH